MPKRFRDTEGPEDPIWDPITQGGLLWEMPPGMYGEWFGPRLSNPDFNPEHSRAMFGYGGGMGSGFPPQLFQLLMRMNGMR